jgi:hypothetical protein
MFAFDPNSAYAYSDAVKGSIPSCLLEMPALTTLHLSGNGFDGTLNKDANIGRNLQNIILSHNAIKRDIPTMLFSREFTKLDL